MPILVVYSVKLLSHCRIGFQPVSLSAAGCFRKKRSTHREKKLTEDRKGPPKNPSESVPSPPCPPCPSCDVPPPARETGWKPILHRVFHFLRAMPFSQTWTKAWTYPELVAR